MSLCFVLILCRSSGNQWGRAEVSVSGGTFQSSSTKGLATSAFELMGNAVYEAEIVKRGMNSIALQPHVADHAYIPHMKAVHVPFD